MWQRYIQSAGGNVALYFALAALPLTIAVGSAVDMARGGEREGACAPGAG
ncbi:MAG: hypothetical protein GVY06_11385 [Alphaproteobacteria bacterium]|nr:hypothetical protein [Alphaproteobacteria bacterium]